MHYNKEHNAKVLRTANLSLVHSKAACHALVWCHSVHIRLIKKPINDTLRIVTGCMRLTPTDNLFILAGIQPTKLGRTFFS